MTTTKLGDLNVVGKITAGNIAQGTVSITPVASTPTSATVTGLSLTGAGTVCPQISVETSLPGSEVIEAAYSGHTTSGLTVYLYRTNTTVTLVHWWLFVNRV